MESSVDLPDEGSPERNTHSDLNTKEAGKASDKAGRAPIRMTFLVGVALEEPTESRISVHRAGREDEAAGSAAPIEASLASEESAKNVDIPLSSLTRSSETSRASTTHSISGVATLTFTCC